MRSLINRVAVAALADQRVDWRYKGLPVGWTGRRAAEICAERPDLFAACPLGPVCVLRAEALEHNLSTMAACAPAAVWSWRRTVRRTWLRAVGAAVRRGGVCGDGGDDQPGAHLSCVRGRRGGAGQRTGALVDAAGLAWLAGELDGDRAFGLICWVDSVRGVRLMTDALPAAGARRPVDVCVELGAAGARTGCRGDAEVDAVAAAVVASPRLRLVGVAGYEAALGHDVYLPGCGRFAIIWGGWGPRRCGCARCVRAAG